jgi:glycosyltransferase involved in cell wall biosynthesis
MIKSVCFLIEGPIDSPAYFRAKGMASEMAKLGINVMAVCDDRPSNSSSILSLQAFDISVKTYSFRPRIFGILQCRKVLRDLNPNWVVQLNPTLRGFLSLSFTRHQVVGEWDEPRILAPQGFLSKALSYLLHSWLLKRALIRISCTNAFLDYLPGATYIPHGQYVSRIGYQPNLSEGEYFVYLGNLFPLFDHELLIQGLDAAAQRGFFPKLLIIGGGPDLELWKSFAKSRNLTNLKFLGYCSVDEWMPILMGAQALLFPMRDTPLNRCRCSSKIFAYLAAGRPIVAHGVGEASELLANKAYLANPGQDLIALLEQKVYQNLKMNDDYPELSYKFLANKFLALMTKYSDKFDS